MPRGGKRTPGEGKALGRPKVSRPVTQQVAARIKAQVKAEKLWIFLIQRSAKKAQETGNTSDLRQALEYLDDRDWGRPVDTVNHLHDKPQQLEVKAMVSIRGTLEKALQRALKR